MDSTYAIQLLSPLSESTTDTALPPKKIRVLTLNLFLRPPLIKNNKSDYKDERLTYFINEILDSYDLICLQEVFGTLTRRRNRLIKSAVQAGFYFSQSPAPSFWSNQITDGGLLVLSRFPIIEQDFQGFYNGMGPDLFTFKGVIYCKISISGETAHVFSTHTQASYHTDDAKLFQYYRNIRRNQLKVMKSFIDVKTQDSKDLVLVLGDMNVDGREKLKDPVFPTVECQDDYEQMISILFGDSLCNYKDLIRSKYGFSPTTFGKVLPNGEPEETVLSHIDEASKDLSLDYIFAMNLESSAFDYSVSDTYVEPFYVSNKHFTRVSDHYGIQTCLYLKTS
ncbi:unnamed protein product [Blepharisma stoltei]|uniref:sphingomyelin phosphodiesterase n=1 Tax=Blepharisma stoltei TaxID=1481888 RepID=A0AAU9JG27_9CILI|nr:unnamed protein product [Blepharisma stoltei]